MPRRTVHSRLVAGVNVAAWAAPPALSTRDEFQFDDALRSQSHRDLAIQLLFGGRHENSHARTKRGHHFRTIHDLRKVRRADLLLSFSHQDEVQGESATGGAHGMERGDE